MKTTIPGNETTMKTEPKVFALRLVVSALVGVLGIGTAPSATSLPLVDDFESGLPAGKNPNGIDVGFSTFQDSNSTVAISTTNAPPSPVPGVVGLNTVLKMDVNVVSYAGFLHRFENASLDAWVSQDWSAYEGLSFWLYGNNGGTTLFMDVLDSRNPGSTTDDAERWSIDIQDNFSGWQEIKIPFASMNRKEIGNGAPNDGFGRTAVYGWALGAGPTEVPRAYYVDKVSVYGSRTTVPEPGTLALLGLGLAGLGLIRRGKAA